MTQGKPAATSQSKPNNPDAIDAKLKIKRRVTYLVTIASDRSLRLPYAVAVNGSALVAHKPGRVNGSGGKIEVMVDPGSKVSLFLNSDAHPSYRKSAVYEVTAGDNDVVVTITEKSGKDTTADTPVLQRSKTDLAAKPPTVDRYTAPLTGDIWMKVSHRYAADEVDALMPQGTSAEVLAAVKSIYRVLSKRELSITVSAGKSAATHSITVTFSDSQNSKDNISKYDLLKDGLTRVHPAGYAALFNAAKAAGISKLIMISTWRPMLGSIAHRAGLGLDVSYVDGTQLNRQELREKGAVVTTNVSEDEKKLLKEFEAAKVKQNAAKKELGAARAVDRRVKSDPRKASIAQEAVIDADAKAKEAESARATAEKAWNDERDRNEPKTVKAFRAALLACPSVRQIFDPWFMDQDAKDAVAATPNMQKSKNEKLHAHHLHITVDEPKIL